MLAVLCGRRRQGWAPAHAGSLATVRGANLPPTTRALPSVPTWTSVSEQACLDECVCARVLGRVCLYTCAWTSVSVHACLDECVCAGVPGRVRLYTRAWTSVSVHACMDDFALFHHARLYPVKFKCLAECRFVMDADENALNTALQELEAALQRKNRQLSKCNKLLRARRPVHSKVPLHGEQQRVVERDEHNGVALRSSASIEGSCSAPRNTPARSETVGVAVATEQSNSGGELQTGCEGHGSLRTGDCQSNNYHSGLCTPGASVSRNAIGTSGQVSLSDECSASCENNDLNLLSRADVSNSGQGSRVVSEMRKTSRLPLDFVSIVTSSKDVDPPVLTNSLNTTDVSCTDWKDSKNGHIIGGRAEGAETSTVKEPVKENLNLIGQPSSLGTNTSCFDTRKMDESRKQNGTYNGKFCGPQTAEFDFMKDSSDEKKVNTKNSSYHLTFNERLHDQRCPVPCANLSSHIPSDFGRLIKTSIFEDEISSGSRHSSTSPKRAGEKLEVELKSLTSKPTPKFDGVPTACQDVCKAIRLKKNVTFREGSPDIFFVSQVSQNETTSTEEKTVVEETEESSIEDDDVPSSCPTEMLSCDFNHSLNSSIKKTNPRYENGVSPKRSFSDIVDGKSSDGYPKTVKDDFKPLKKRIRLDEELELFSSEQKEYVQCPDEAKLESRKWEIDEASQTPSEDKENLANSSPIVSSNIASPCFLELACFSPIVSKDLPYLRDVTQKTETREIRTRLKKPGKAKCQNNKFKLNFVDKASTGFQIVEPPSTHTKIKTHCCSFYSTQRACTPCHYSSEDSLRVSLNDRHSDALISLDVPRDASRGPPDAPPVSDTPQWQCLQDGGQGIEVLKCCLQAGTAPDGRPHVLVVHMGGLQLWACTLHASTAQWTEVVAPACEWQPLDDSARERLLVSSLLFDEPDATTADRSDPTCSCWRPSSSSRAELVSCCCSATGDSSGRNTKPRDISTLDRFSSAAFTSTVPSTSTAASTSIVTSNSAVISTSNATVAPMATAAALCRFVVLWPLQDAVSWRVMLVEARPSLASSSCQMITLATHLPLLGVSSVGNTLCCGAGDWSVVLAQPSSHSNQSSVRVMELEEVYRKRWQRPELLCDVRLLRTSIAPRLRALLPLSPRLSGTAGHGVVVGHHETGLQLLDTKLDVILKDISWGPPPSPGLSPKPTFPFPGSPSFLVDDSLSGINLADSTDLAGGTSPALESFTEIDVDTIVLVIFDQDTLQWVYRDLKGRLMLCSCYDIIQRPRFELRQLTLQDWNTWPRTAGGLTTNLRSSDTPPLGTVTGASLTPRASLFLLTDRAWVASFSITKTRITEN
ncbi:hypothetical protein FHG87_005159 [Trinorchestia longiramus]|nr:hypothetical protein FHG87_005159 [Trinorchestia longiramus]